MLKQLSKKFSNLYKTKAVVFSELYLPKVNIQKIIVDRFDQSVKVEGLGGMNNRYSNVEGALLTQRILKTHLDNNKKIKESKNWVKIQKDQQLLKQFDINRIANIKVDRSNGGEPKLDIVYRKNCYSTTFYDDPDQHWMRWGSFIGATLYAPFYPAFFAIVPGILSGYIASRFVNKTLLETNLYKYKKYE